MHGDKKLIPQWHCSFYQHRWGSTVIKRSVSSRAEKKDFSGGQNPFSRAVEERGKVAGIEEERRNGMKGKRRSAWGDEGSRGWEWKLVAARWEIHNAVAGRLRHPLTHPSPERGKGCCCRREGERQRERVCRGRSEEENRPRRRWRCDGVNGGRGKGGGLAEGVGSARESTKGCIDLRGQGKARVSPRRTCRGQQFTRLGF